ncbi:MAG: DNA-binding domain-containing protein [Hyphomicrobiales bacterium]
MLHDFASGLLDPTAPPPEGVGQGQRKRYGVYRNNVTVGLIAAVEANFPALQQLLGPAYFTGLAREFLRLHPPQSPLLFLYGEHFAAFMAAREDLAAFPYLADVARIEQAWRRAYHAADATPFSAAALASLPADALETLRLAAHPALALIPSRHAAHSIFVANRSGAAESPADWMRPETTLVTRPGFEVLTRTVSPGEAAFISALASGLALPQAAEEGAAADSRFDLGAALAVALSAGAFIIS